MSAKARGIILSGDVGKLIIEASDAEVERFARHDLVEIDLLDRPAWHGELTPPRMYFYGNPMFVGSSWPAFESEQRTAAAGNAKLVTRCGCERWVQLPNPRPRTFHVAMHEPPATTSMTSRIRNFEFQRAEHDASGRRYHVYEEAW